MAQAIHLKAITSGRGFFHCSYRRPIPLRHHPSTSAAMPKPSNFGKYNDMNTILTDDQKADGWKYSLTKEEQWDTFGYVVSEQIRFRLMVKEGNFDVVEDYLETKLDQIDVNLPDSLGM